MPRTLFRNNGQAQTGGSRKPERKTMYVLLGSNGNITSKAAQLLLAQGEKVRVVGRNAASLESLRKAGADIAAGDIADSSFLANAFAGAKAVYTMIPPDYAAPDMPARQDELG